MNDKIGSGSEHTINEVDLSVHDETPRGSRAATLVGVPVEVGADWSAREQVHQLGLAVDQRLRALIPWRDRAAGP
jgi:hypothetical protein